MPNLVDIEAFCKMLRNSVLNQQVTNVNCREQGNGPRAGDFDEKVYDNAKDEREVEKGIMGKKFVAAHRKGKMLWMEFKGRGSKNVYLLFHFSMSGRLHVKTLEEQAGYNWPPKFCKLEITFGKGEQENRLAFSDQRRFGRIRFQQEDPRKTEPVKSLAADPLISPISLEDFEAIVTQSSAPIKGILLDQREAISGLGNYFSDEALYHAGILPDSPGKMLSHAQVKKLYDSIFYVIETADAVDADREKYPDSWLFHHKFNKRKKGSEKIDGHPVQFQKVAGRTTAVVPDVQKRGEIGSNEEEEKEDEMDEEEDGGADDNYEEYDETNDQDYNDEDMKRDERKEGDVEYNVDAEEDEESMEDEGEEDEDVIENYLDVAERKDLDYKVDDLKRDEANEADIEYKADTPIKADDL